MFFSTDYSMLSIISEDIYVFNIDIKKFTKTLCDSDKKCRTFMIGIYQKY